MEELDLKGLLEIFWNKKAEIICIVVALAIIGGIYSYFGITPKYTSYTTVLLTQTGGNEGSQASSITQTDVNLNSKLVSTYGVLIKSKTVLNEVLDNLKNTGITGLTYGQLKNSIKVKTESDTEVIRIEVTNEDPELSAKIANEIAKVFSQKIPEIYNISNVYIVDKAEIAKNPSNINHLKDLVIFAFIGVVIAVIYVLLGNLLDNTIKTEEDVEKVTGLPVIAAIYNYDYQTESKGGNK